MWLENFQIDPLNNVNQELKNEKNVKLSEDSKINDVLKWVLEKYNINKVEFEKILLKWETQTFLSELKKQVSNWDDYNLEKLVDLTYRHFLNEKLSKPWAENEITSFEKFNEWIWDKKLNKLNKFIGDLIDKKIEKFDFIDNKTKNILKIHILNSSFENWLWDILKSFWWWLKDLFNKINSSSPQDLDKIINEIKQNPTEPKISIAWLDIILSKIKPFEEKFNEIKKLFDEKRLDKTNQKAIFSNIDFLKNTNNFNSIQNLDVSKIDLTKNIFNNLWFNNEDLSSFLINSRKNQIELSKIITSWENLENTIYKIWNNELLSEKNSDLMKILFKIPVFGKLLSSYLWYNSENPLLDYENYNKWFWLLENFKKLWDEKIDWLEILKWKTINVDFHKNKEDLKILSELFPNLKTNKDYEDFWKKAFSTEWYKNDNNENLSFKIKENTIKKLIEDNNINDKDLSIILKESISDYKKDLNDIKDKEKQMPSLPKSHNNESTTSEQEKISVDIEKTKEEPKKDEKQEENHTVNIQTGNAFTWSQSIIDNQSNNDIEIFSTINPELTKKAWEFLLNDKKEEIINNNLTWVFWDLYQFKNINCEELINSGKNFRQVLINNLWEHDLNKLWEEKINLLNESLRLTYYFIKNDNISYKWKTIDFFWDKEAFQEFITKNSWQ